MWEQTAVSETLCMRTDGTTRGAPSFFRGVWALIDISWITKPVWKHPVMTQCWPSSLFVLHKIQFGLLSTLPPLFFNVDTVISRMGSFLRPLPSSALHPIQSQWMNFAYNERCITTGERLPRRADELCRIAQKSMFRKCCWVYFKYGPTFSMRKVCSQPSILQLLLIFGCDFDCCYFSLLLLLLLLLIIILIPWIRVNFSEADTAQLLGFITMFCKDLPLDTILSQEE